MRTAARFLAAGALLLAPGGEAVAAVPAGFPVGTAGQFTQAGDRVLLWGGERPELLLREPDGTVREIHRAVQRRRISSVITDVAATPSQVAFITEGFQRFGDGGAAWSSLRAGPLGGPYRLIAGREDARGRIEPRDVALSDAGLLFSDDRGVVLRPADGGAPVRLGGTGGESITVNGRYVAARTSTHATVYDLASRTRVARVAAEMGPGFPPGAGASADGTLVFNDERRRLWAFVPSTGERTLLLRGADEIARVAGSTVYVVKRSSGSYAQSLAQLWAVDVPGGGRRPVTEAVLGGEFGTDGVRAVYQRDGCAFTGDLLAPERAPVTADCPRQAFHFSVAEIQRRPEVPMGVTCPGAAADRCTGTARLTAARAGGRVVLGTWQFDAAGGTSVRHTLRLRRADVAGVTARLRITGSPYGKVRRPIVFDVRQGGGAPRLRAR